MIPKSREAKGGLDRLATPDEIQLALAPLDDCAVKEQPGGTWLEIPYDCGGYVRFSAEEIEFLYLAGELDRVAK